MVGSVGPARQGLYDPRNEHDACGVGFIAHIKNRKSHAIVSDGIRILLNLAHRGAVSADPLAGDGAGILLQLPDRLLRAEAKRLGFALPPLGEYGVGMMFLPRNAQTRAACEEPKIHLVTVDSKVVDLGMGAQVFIIPTGIGLVPERRTPSISNARPAHSALLFVPSAYVGLAIILTIFRTRQSSSVDDANLLKY